MEMVTHTDHQVQRTVDLVAEGLQAKMVMPAQHLPRSHSMPGCPIYRPHHTKTIATRRAIGRHKRLEVRTLITKVTCQDRTKNPLTLPRHIHIRDPVNRKRGVTTRVAESPAHQVCESVCGIWRCCVASVESLLLFKTIIGPGLCLRCLYSLCLFIFLVSPLILIFLLISFCVYY